MKHPLPDLPIIGFAAYSGTGKTTLLEKLIPFLIQSGRQIALIKHAHHHFDIDQVGKDSDRFRKAGARQVIISSKKRVASIKETPDKETPFHQLIEQIDRAKVDLILVEGFKNEQFTKIELRRDILKKPWLYPFDEHIIAIASDTVKNPDVPENLIQLDINSPKDIARFILNWAKKKDKPETKKPFSCDQLSGATLSVKEAKTQILNAISFAHASELSSLTRLSNKVLSQAIIAPINVPSITNSAMDGYAIRGEDCHLNSFKLVGELKAGYQFTKPLLKGECVEIMTGAPLPKNADTVIIKEQVTRLPDEQIALKQGQQPIFPQQNVRLAGEDLQQNSKVLAKGKRLNAADVGMIASLGLEQVYTYQALKVAIFSTGDEVISQNEPKAHEKTYDTNRFTLHALLTKLGCSVIDLGIIDDNQKRIEQTLLTAAKQADVIITSGGVSVGKADFTKSALEKSGKVDFWRIRMRPGRPLAFGHVHQTPFFALPGNPVAVMVTFIQFVEPAIRKAQGEINWHRETFTAITETKLASRLGRTDFLRGIYYTDSHGQIQVKSTGAQGSGILHSMSIANCLIKIPPEREKIQKGETVSIILLNI